MTVEVSFDESAENAGSDASEESGGGNGPVH